MVTPPLCRCSLGVHGIVAYLPCGIPTSLRHEGRANFTASHLGSGDGKKGTIYSMKQGESPPQSPLGKLQLKSHPMMGIFIFRLDDLLPVFTQQIVKHNIIIAHINDGNFDVYPFLFV